LMGRQEVVANSVYKCNDLTYNFRLDVILFEAL
jgi:hypothetical protein